MFKSLLYSEQTVRGYTLSVYVRLTFSLFASPRHGMDIPKKDKQSFHQKH